MAGMDRIVDAFAGDSGLAPVPSTTLELDESAPVVQVVTRILTEAVRDRASDIHIEPQDSQLRVRFRIDGVLNETQRIPKRSAIGVTTRLKVLAKLDIAERRKPQDGRISLNASAAGRLLDLVGMGADAERPCGELAYGDLKRLELAVALANQPKLLLMDEPTAGMAPRERIELMHLTAQIAREQSIGVLFTEHDMDVVFEHADRILVLNRGTLIAQGSPAEVRGNPQVRAVYLGEGLVYDARHREGAPS